MSDSFAKSSTYAAWFSAVVSLIALGVAWLSYLQTVQPEKLEVRFRYVTISLGGEITDPLQKLRDVTSDQVAVVENKLFPEMVRATAAYRDKSEDEFLAAPEFSFLVMENVSSAYFEDVEVKAELLELTDSGAYSDNPSDSEIKSRTQTNAKLTGVKPGEFVAFPTKLRENRPHGNRYKVKSFCLGSNGGQVTEVAVREELEAKVNIQGAKTGH